MQRIILALFLLAGCTPIYFNEPNLASPPTDQAKYHADLKECEDAQRQTPSEVLAGGMGALPLTAFMLVEGKGDDVLKSNYTRRDECMQKRGYVLK